MIPVQGKQVWYLIGELRSNLPRCAAKKKKKRLHQHWPVRTDMATNNSSHLQQTLSLLLFSHCVLSSSCDPIDCSLPDSSVYGICQARILQWVAISFSRGSFQPRDQTCVSCISGGFFTTEPLGKPDAIVLDIFEHGSWLFLNGRNTPFSHRGRCFSFLWT